MSTSSAEEKAVFRKGSKTFSLAARVFRPDDFEATVRLYGWLRYCDDFFDQTDNQPKIEDLKRLRDWTQWSFGVGHTASLHPVFLSLREVVLQKRISASQYAEDFLDGMQMDLLGHDYQDQEELRLYCYRVAGTVGVLMSQLCGVTASGATPYAIELGIALQQTNIARDVLEDSSLGRVYLPKALLQVHGLARDELLNASRFQDAAFRARLFEVVKHLLKEADVSYRTARRGYPYLPARAALAVSIAAELYRSIGKQLLKRGPDGLLTRTVITRPRKIRAIAKGLLHFGVSRLRTPAQSSLEVPAHVAR